MDWISSKKRKIQDENNVLFGVPSSSEATYEKCKKYERVFSCKIISFPDKKKPFLYYYQNNDNA